METFAPGELVNVTDGGAVVDGIVFETPSPSKVVVAVIDPGRGPKFRSVRPEALAARTTEGPADPALRLLIRRTQPSVRGTGGGGPNVRKGAPGFTRGASHRSTGR